MSKQWKEKHKVLVVVLVIASMLIGAVPLTQPIVSEATTVKTESNTNPNIINGDFESGRVGYSVRGWELTAMRNGLTIATDPTEIESFLSAYEFVTSEKADGNRIASLTKKGNGYVAMTSQLFAVEGGTPYRISYNYCVERIVNKRDSLTNKDFQGISILIKEVNADDEVTWTKLDRNDYGNALIATEDYREVTENGVTYHKYESNSWHTVTKEFCPATDTIAAQLYIRVGAKGNVTGTVLLDNVCIDEYAMYDVPNGDFRSTTHEADGGRAEWSVADTGAITQPSGVAGWTSVSTNQNGKESDTNNYHNNYAATVVHESGNAVMKYTYTEAGQNKASGYAWILSPSIAVEAGESVAASYRYKITGKIMQNAKSAIFFYDEDGNELSRVRTTNLGTGELEWTTRITNETEVPADATYAKVGFYIGRKKGTGEDYPIPVGSNYYDQFTLYFDDVTLTGEAKEWTAESCDSNGKPSGTDVTAHYTIKQMKEYETGHRNAWQLSVADVGSSGVVAFYSNPVDIDSTKKYTTAFDYKIEGIDSTNGNRLIKIMYLFRYLDSSGNPINGSSPQLVFAYRISGFSENYEDANTDGWISEHVEITDIPADARKVQIGLTIGTNGSVDYDRMKNLTYSWDNIVLMKTEAYEDYIKDPAVTASPLYEKTALFAGASAGNDIATFAQSYSEMQVTDVCDSQTTIKEQLAANSGGVYDYLFLNIGEEELESGLVEDLFANVALYYDGLKVVCLLTADNAKYQAIVEAAAAKWNVTLVVVGAYESAEVRWQETIEPAEETATFDCYEIAGFGTYLTDLFRDMEAAGVSVATDMTALESILLKAKNCPDTDEDYQALSSLAVEVEQFIAQFDNLRPELKGATIALNDPNQLQFLGIAPKQELTGGVTVKQMGIAVTEGNSSPMQLSVAYTKAGEAYGVLMDVKDVDPSVSYTAVAYIIYEADGKEYAYYSNNDYVNTVGEKTVENGQCTKSVYEIARKVALKLAIREGTDFSAIGGKQNINLIATATKESEISLHNVYQMLGENVENLLAWLNGGGITR